MQVTITKLRKDLFKLVDQALGGASLQFTYKGVVFSIVPERRVSKLANLTRQTIVTPQAELDQANRALFKEMEAEWEKDWAEL
jgi:antitoxin (DNA-binding transcriptional repressor) of toxin-antitoxin stability system